MIKKFVKWLFYRWFLSEWCAGYNNAIERMEYSEKKKGGYMLIQNLVCRAICADAEDCNILKPCEDAKKTMREIDSYYTTIFKAKFNQYQVHGLLDVSNMEKIIEDLRHGKV